MNYKNTDQEQNALDGNETIHNQRIKNKQEEENEKEIYETIKKACLNGDINTFKKYLFSESNNNSINFDINKIFEYRIIGQNGFSYDKKASLLHICCEKGNSEITQLICTHSNINLNLKNEKGRTPFYEACFYSQLNIIEFLCEIPQVDINSEDNYGWTPLHYSCRYNKIDIIKILLKQTNKIEINKKNIFVGYSSLHFTCCDGKLEIVKLLCEENNNNKIDINLRNNKGETAFYIACERGNSEIVKYLFFKYKINNNFYENQISNNGFSPLYISCKNGDFEIVKLLLENNIYDAEI